jgi:predicted transcriptional regulator
MAEKKVKISFRASEELSGMIDRLSRRRGVSESQIVEDAIKSSHQSDLDESMEAFSSSFGAWKRDESPEETVEMVRKLFADSMLRHQRLR